jgi:hypothetical protein
MIAANVLVSEVCKNLQIDNISLNVSRFKIEENINQAQRHLLMTLPIKKISEGVYVGYGNISSGTTDYNLPDGLLRLIKIYVDFSGTITGTNRGRELITVPAAGFTQDNVDRQSMNLYPYGTIINNIPLSGWSGYTSGYNGKLVMEQSPSGTVASGIKYIYVSSMQYVRQQYLGISGVSGYSGGYPAQPCFLSDDKFNLIVYYSTALSATVNTYSLELYKNFMELFNFELQKYITN